LRVRLRAGLAAVVAIEATTGVYLFGCERLSRAYLGWMLAHLGLGLVATLLLAILLVIPAQLFLPRRVKPFHPTPGPGLAFLRASPWLILLWSSLGTLALSGICLGAHGTLGWGRAALLLHRVSALIFLSAVAVRGVKLFLENVKSVQDLVSLSRRSQVRVTALLVLVLASAAFVYRESSYSEEIGRTYSFKFGPNPFAPGQVRTDGGSFLSADQFLPASYCARCHAGAHAQWQESAHRSSFREPFYKKNVDLFIARYGIEVTRHCEGCHNPIALVSGALTSGSTLKRPFDDEGVTCTVCHSITKVTWLEGIGSYELARPVVLLGEDGAPLRSWVNDKMILLKPELHKKAMMRELYRTPEFCAVCHKSALPKEIENYKWRRAFSTYDEWQTSAHSNESVLPFYKKPRNTCQTCHMPLDETPGDVAAKNGKLASHRWAAANTAIPFFYGFNEQLAAVQQFLRGRRLTVDIFTLQKGPAYPSQADATDLIGLRKGAAGSRIGEGFTTINAINTALYAPAPAERSLIAPLDKREFSLRAGETITMGVVVANPGVGHIFPTELRDFFEPWVEFKVEQADGKVIYHSGFLNKDCYLDERAHIFQSIQVSEKAEWVRHHNIWDSRGKAYDNFLAPGRSELIRYQFTIPRSARAPLRVTARVLYR